MVILQVILMITSCIYAQEVTFEIINATKKAEIFKLEGEKSLKIDSVYSENGMFTFSMDGQSTGLYRFQLDNLHAISFIYESTEISIKTDYNNIWDSIEIQKSESNKLFHSFLKLNSEYKTKTELLQLILARFPKDDQYYNDTQKRVTELQEQYQNFISLTSEDNSKTFVDRYIRTAQLPIIPQTIDVNNQIDFLKSHSLNNVDFEDAGLIYSDAFTNKTIEYLTYFRNPQLPKELLEKEFMKAVDTLLNKAKVNQLVYQHITEYLIDGFKKFGFDKIIDYIIENYVIEDDLCLDEETENSIQRRIDQSKLLSIGTKAPNFIMSDKDGKVIDLSKIKSNKTLLVFYASWCPHCKELLPQLNEFRKSNKKIEILAISLDSKQEDWIKFIDNNEIELLNLNDPNGWDGTTASDYYIYATPTMFLLESEKKIIGKPTTYEELKELL